MSKSKEINKRQSREQSIRREKVKELYLKGVPGSKIATTLNAHYNTIVSDLDYIKTNYLEMAIKNPALIQKQFAKVEELLDEVTMVKNQYWKILNEIGEEREEKQEALKEKYELDMIASDADKSKDKIIPKLKVAPRNFSTRLETLRAIMTRVDHEARLLNLFNTGTIIEKNYVSMDTLKQIMSIFKGIIMDLIPKDKQSFAIRRMKTIEIKGISPDDIQKSQKAEEAAEPDTVEELKVEEPLEATGEFTPIEETTESVIIDEPGVVQLEEPEEPEVRKITEGTKTEETFEDLDFDTL